MLRRTQALSVLHEEASADTEQADPAKPTLGTAFQQLLQTIQASACPSYTAVTLLRALDHVNGEVRARAKRVVAAHYALLMSSRVAAVAEVNDVFGRC